MGKVNCERYKQLCSQVLHTSENQAHILTYISKAEVTGYPTVRIYNRADDFLVSNFNSNFNKFLKLNETQPVFQDYELVRKREVNDIVNLVKDILKEGEIIKKKKKQKAGKEEKEKEEKSLRDEL